MDKNTTTTDANGKTVTKYEGSDLDKYLNETWYDSLTSTAQTAIVTSNITQYSYAFSSDIYDSQTHASYANYSSKAAVESAITKKVYSLDVEDIEEYVRGTFSSKDIWTLFWNTSSAPSTTTYPWLRSANATQSNFAQCVLGDYGYLSSSRVSFIRYGAARPAFKIDLSKIDWNSYAG